MSRVHTLATRGSAPYVGPMADEPDFTEEEIRQRRDAAILRALNTPL